jgi:hypothetical protein
MSGPYHHEDSGLQVSYDLHKWHRARATIAPRAPRGLLLHLRL